MAQQEHTEVQVLVVVVQVLAQEALEEDQAAMVRVEVAAQEALEEATVATEEAITLAVAPSSPI